MRRIVVGLVGVIAATVLLAACGRSSPAAPQSSAAPCVMPALPTPGRSSGSLGFRMGGPAVGALQGGAAHQSFSLDGGDLQVDVPTGGARPTITEGDAVCKVMAALTPNGELVAALAEQSGLAVGYGDVTVAPALTAERDEAGDGDDDTRGRHPDRASPAAAARVRSPSGVGDRRAEHHDCVLP